MRHNHHGPCRNQHDRRKIVTGIKGHVRNQTRIRPMGIKNKNKGMAIWRGLRSSLGTDRTITARAIFDQDLGTERLR